jgi:ubiquinone biosynthesis protein UbiJ
VLLEACQRIVNRCVAESAAAVAVLADLDGTTFGLEIEGTGLEVVMAVTGGEVRLARGGVADADAMLRATPFDLLRLLDEGSLTGLKATRAELRGRLGVAEAYAELMRLARPDIEDELAGWIGDVAAYEVSGIARRAAAFGRRARAALELDAAEYLRDERAVLVGPRDLERFSADVETLRDAVERAEARLAALGATARPVMSAT